MSQVNEKDGKRTRSSSTLTALVDFSPVGRPAKRLVSNEKVIAETQVYVSIRDKEKSRVCIIFLMTKNMTANEALLLQNST